LLSIADDAGGLWPTRARAALLDVFRRRAADSGKTEASALLLVDLQNLFRLRNAKHLTSENIVNALGGMEDRPWPEWNSGESMTTPQLAKVLKLFGVRPQNLRVSKHVVKGYTAHSLTDAWERYLPTVPIADASHS